MPYIRIAFLALAASLAAAIACAEDYSAGSIKVSGVWTREVPAGSKVAAGFMTITNTGKEPDTLIGGSIPIAEKFEVHEMKMKGGVMEMRQLEPGLTIKPGETVVLRPGSFHLMFMDLKQRPKRGASVKGTLLFEKAGQLDVVYKVESTGARELSAGKKPSPKHEMKPQSGGHNHH